MRAVGFLHGHAFVKLRIGRLAVWVGALATARKIEFYLRSQQLNLAIERGASSTKDAKRPFSEPLSSAEPVCSDCEVRRIPNQANRVPSVSLCKVNVRACFPKACSFGGRWVLHATQQQQADDRNECYFPFIIWRQRAAGLVAPFSLSSRTHC